jgi:hypothetical protein
LPGRTITEHSALIAFWSELIESGRLEVPFEVVHVDAHPDFAIKGVLRLRCGYLSVQRGFTEFDAGDLDSGNYLTLAIANGWLSSLLWVKLDAARTFAPVKTKPRGEEEITALPARAAEVAFGCMECSEFRVSKRFDYMVLSKSPEFTLVKSDLLVPVIEEYMNKI